MSTSGFMGHLKGKSALLIFQRRENMKFACRNCEFWCKGYYVDTAGENTKVIKEYIANQLKHDKESDQLSFFDPQNPFMGNKQQLHAGRPIKNALVHCQYPLGLCPKMKYHLQSGWMFIYFLPCRASRIICQDFSSYNRRALKYQTKAGDPRQVLHSLFIPCTP